MQYTARALVSILFIASHCGVSAADEVSRFAWWPFGSKAAPASSGEGSMTATAASPAGTAQPLGSMPTAGTTVTTSATVPNGASMPIAPHEPLPQYSPPAASERRWMIQSPLASVTWPRIHMPEISLPKPRLPRPQLWLQESEVDEARNAWVGKSFDPERPSPLQAARQGARRVVDSTRTAWHKTINVLTPGEPMAASASFAQAAPRPPFWKRMFAAEESQPQGPRTVTEWMAQDRLDP
jgi:hypothetical protein